MNLDDSYSFINFRVICWLGYVRGLLLNVFFYFIVCVLMNQIARLLGLRKKNSSISTQNEPNRSQNQANRVMGKWLSKMVRESHSMGSLG